MPRVPQGRVILQGWLAQGADIWTMSFAMDPLNTRSQAELDGLAQETAELFQNHVWSATDIESKISSSVAYTGCRIDDVQNPGGVVRTSTYSFTEPILGAGAFPQLPSEVSVCISLRTGLPGPTRRGRMYFPPLMSDQCDFQGNLSGTAQTDLADAMADFFTQFNDSGAIAGTAFVASDKAQQLTAITGIQVGSVFDSQRRRRNAIQEIYVNRPVFGT